MKGQHYLKSLKVHREKTIFFAENKIREKKTKKYKEKYKKKTKKYKEKYKKKTKKYKEKYKKR